MRSKIYISSDGNVYPCSLYEERMGNLYEETLENIWLGEESSNFRKLFICPKKESCNLKKTGRCGGKCKALLKNKLFNII
ncbi:MAG: SPASM domain-containing protein [Candidatus Pacearchaeota archaeon]